MVMAKGTKGAIGVIVAATAATVIALGQTAPEIGKVDQRAAGMFERSLLPIGAVVPFFGDPAMLREMGDTWQLCDGAPLAASADPRLRAALAGNGDPASARVPQLAKQVLYGAGDGVEVNASFGSATHSHAMDHVHDVESIVVQNVTLSGSTADAALRDTSAQMGRPGSWNGVAGKFVSHAEEDTLSVRFSGHRHSVSVNGVITIPAHKTEPSSVKQTSDAEHYPPGIGAYFVMRVR